MRNQYTMEEKQRFVGLFQGDESITYRQLYLQQKHRVYLEMKDSIYRDMR